MELKTHKEYKRYQYNNAFDQTIANNETVLDFLSKTAYIPSNVHYALVYYIRNEYLLIKLIDGTEYRYDKSNKVSIVQFLEESFVSSNIIENR